MANKKEGVKASKTSTPKIPRKTKKTSRKFYIKAVLKWGAVAGAVLILFYFFQRLDAFDFSKLNRRIPETKKVNGTYSSNPAIEQTIKMIHQAMADQNAIDLYQASKLLAYLEKNSTRSLFHMFQSHFNLNDIQTGIEFLEQIGDDVPDKEKFTKMLQRAKKDAKILAMMRKTNDDRFLMTPKDKILRKFEGLKPLSIAEDFSVIDRETNSQKRERLLKENSVEYNPDIDPLDVFVNSGENDTAILSSGVDWKSLDDLLEEEEMIGRSLGWHMTYSTEHLDMRRKAILERIAEEEAEEVENKKTESEGEENTEIKSDTSNSTVETTEANESNSTENASKKTENNKESPKTKKPHKPQNLFQELPPLEPFEPYIPDAIKYKRNGLTQDWLSAHMAVMLAQSHGMMGKLNGTSISRVVKCVSVMTQMKNVYAMNKASGECLDLLRKIAEDDVERAEAEAKQKAAAKNGGEELKLEKGEGLFGDEDKYKGMIDEKTGLFDVDKYMEERLRKEKEKEEMRKNGTWTKEDDEREEREREERIRKAEEEEKQEEEEERKAEEERKKQRELAGQTNGTANATQKVDKYDIDALPPELRVLQHRPAMVFDPVGALGVIQDLLDAYCMMRTELMMDPEGAMGTLFTPEFTKRLHEMVTHTSGLYHDNSGFLHGGISLTLKGKWKQHGNDVVVVGGKRRLYCQPMNVEKEVNRLLMLTRMYIGEIDNIRKEKVNEIEQKIKQRGFEDPESATPSDRHSFETNFKQSPKMPLSPVVSPSSLAAWFIDRFIDISPFDAYNEVVAQLLGSAIMMHFGFLPISFFDPSQMQNSMNLYNDESSSNSLDSLYVTQSVADYSQEFYGALRRIDQSSSRSLLPLLDVIVRSQERLAASVYSLPFSVDGNEWRLNVTEGLDEEKQWKRMNKIVREMKEIAFNVTNDFAKAKEKEALAKREEDERKEKERAMAAGEEISDKKTIFPPTIPFMVSYDSYLLPGNSAFFHRDEIRYHKKPANQASNASTSNGTEASTDAAENDDEFSFDFVPSTSIESASMSGLVELRKVFPRPPHSLLLQHEMVAPVWWARACVVTPVEMMGAHSPVVVDEPFYVFLDELDETEDEKGMEIQPIQKSDEPQADKTESGSDKSNENSADAEKKSEKEESESSGEPGFYIARYGWRERYRKWLSHLISETFL
ncbi:uncharacterized protein MONOS_391 [Monocercomonoides exilis]|uniref:uncharacterized protein n=1 Tax=Monocercomonoides exilis TaxID=2049356 RepID=UPI003559A11C|nr:hypothetical protein MONOS_391 [Monocercomonoides exilis]|eukprot:MONOS_391.1-p1 / transcript=MONOS_391.1 / gene=MONOS_391 / organism=Monocercomonoides_exilis_PA203 / gene_product=unspecified product / transcript_product=unspecified product / location=Mono_scaffold00006:196115-199651(-) / protein_length=1179 / sequence_SO=supercontig / SO=protein_coding / is_pseudo=false